MYKIEQLASLFVIDDRPTIEDNSEARYNQQVIPDVIETATFEYYHTHHLYKISDRIKLGEDLCPIRHTIDRSIKPSQQNKNHDDEK
jgi:hypothetical protein